MKTAPPEDTVYFVKTPAFEGPFELLLELVEKRKLFINEISLSQVTDEYLSHIRATKYSPEDATVFILVAATLVLIKSRSLLPSLSLTEEEEKSITNLEHRLGLYQYISLLTPSIKEQFGKNPITLAPERKVQSTPSFVPDPAITPETMETLVRGMIHAIPKKAEPNPEVTMKKVVSIEEMIESLTERITREVKISFRSLTNSGRANMTKEERVTVIVSFLAMLELVRNGLMEAMQGGQFGDIELERRAPEDEKVVHDAEEAPTTYNE